MITIEILNTLNKLKDLLSQDTVTDEDRLEVLSNLNICTYCGKNKHISTAAGEFEATNCYCMRDD